MELSKTTDCAPDCAPDCALVTRYLVDGSDEAFEAIYNRYNVALIDLLGSIWQIPIEEIEDILQLTWSRVFTHLVDYNLDLNLRNWLYKIARNCANTYYNNQCQRRGGQVTIVSLEGENLVFDNRNGHHVFDPSKTLEMKETLDKVLAGIERLPRQDRNIMHYVCIEGLTWRETAELLEITEGVLRGSLERSRTQLGRL